jgi:hypothetical protein
MRKCLLLLIAAGALLAAPVAAATSGELTPAALALRSTPTGSGKFAPGSRPIRPVNLAERVVLLDCWRS